MAEEKRTVRVRGLVIGEGIPKICVPVVDEEEEGILETAEKIAASKADFLEWRADYFSGAHDSARVKELLSGMRNAVGDMPVLVTYRTAAEGGAAEEEFTEEEYLAFCREVLADSEADLVDVEQRVGKENAEELIRTAHAHGKSVLLSGHDFQKTPEGSVLLSRYEEMEAWGADIRKLAVMPQTRADVLMLLSACEQASRSGAPVIGIAMGSLGAESRICGELFGSAVTFGCLGRSSAPGQIEAGELAEWLAGVHSLHVR